MILTPCPYDSYQMMGSRHGARAHRVHSEGGGGCLRASALVARRAQHSGSSALVTLLGLRLLSGCTLFHAVLNSQTSVFGAHYFGGF